MAWTHPGVALATPSRMAGATLSRASGRLPSIYASHASHASVHSYGPVFNLEELTAANAQLALENDVIERYLSRMEPDLLIDLPQAIEKMAMQEHRANMYMRAVGSATTFTTFCDVESVESSANLTQGVVPTAITTSYKWMKTDLKLEMTVRETGDLRTELARFQAAHARRYADLRAHAQQLTESAAEIVAASMDFDKKMKLAAEAFGRGGSAERWQQFLEEWLRRAEIGRETMRLRTNQLRKTEKSLRAQLRIKTELRQFVRAPHVQQMQCEHSDLLKGLVERGVHYKEIKKLTGHTKLELTSFKDELLRHERALAETQQAVAQCAAKVARISHLKPPVAKEVLESFNKLHQLHEYRKSYTAPPIIEYVRAKSELDELRRQVAIARRKRDVQHGTLVASAKKLRTSDARLLAAGDAFQSLAALVTPGRSPKPRREGVARKLVF